VSSSSALDRPITLAELVDAAAVDEVIKSFAEFHGVGISLCDPGEDGNVGKVLVAAGMPQELCEAVRLKPAGLSRCEGKLRETRTLRPIIDAGAPAVCDCFTGFRYQIHPLLHEGSMLGTLVLGPYQPDDRPKQVTGVVQNLIDLREAEVTLAGVKPMSDGTAKRIVEQVGRTLGVVLHTAYARHLAAQLHLATIEDAYTELADKNKRLADAVERMQEVDRLKSNFLATVSHELRTPLTSVIGYSEMLLEGLAGALNEEQREYVHTIMEKGDQLLQLISGILDVSRTEAGTLRVVREPVDLCDVIGGALSVMRPLIARKHLALRAPVEAPRVVGDRDKIRQILMNLIGNAIKFTPDGGNIEVAVELGPLVREDDRRIAPPTVTALGTGPVPPSILPPGLPAAVALGSSSPATPPPIADPNGLGVRLRVRDSGIGIAKEKQARIFEPFFQVDSSSTREYGGTGLGLTLVKSFVEAHGGRVWVDSELGQGSSFTVTLPALAEDVSTFLRRDGNEPTGDGHAQPDRPSGRPVA
jgi:signal transduction histidine kinase